MLYCYRKTCTLINHENIKENISKFIAAHHKNITHEEWSILKQYLPRDYHHYQSTKKVL